MIDCDTFVKSVLAAMWMLNDLPRAMRKDLNSQLGVIWLLISDQKCFPTLTFTPEQQEAICRALEASSDDPENFKFTYEAMVKNNDFKTAGVQEPPSPSLPPSETEPSSSSSASFSGDE